MRVQFSDASLLDRCIIEAMADQLTEVQARVPERLLEQVRVLVAQGWFTDENAVLLEALRRYLDAHQSEVLERFVRDDVDWGLGGHD